MTGRWHASRIGCAPPSSRRGRPRSLPWQREHGDLFEGLSSTERQYLAAETSPVRGWTTTRMRTRDGMPISRRQGLTDPPLAGMWMARSEIYLAVREDIPQVLVVFDMDQVRGESLVRLADCTTMRGLARTRPVEGDPATDTIRTLFHSDASPAGMTRFDRAYRCPVSQHPEHARDRQAARRQSPAAFAGSGRCRWISGPGGAPPARPRQGRGVSFSSAPLVSSVSR